MKKLVLCLAFLLAFNTVVMGYTAYWFDGYDTSAPSNDINFEYNTARQGGFYVPYVESPADATGTDWRSQDTSMNLLLANDGTLPAYGQPNWSATMATPNNDFSGIVGTDVIGTKVDFVVTVDNTAGGYSWAGAAFGAPLSIRDAAGAFSVTLVQDNLAGGLGSFVQVFDNGTLYNFTDAAPYFSAGGANFVEVFFTSTDGNANPWDGGLMDVGFAINGNPIGSIGTSGYNQNYVTLQGSWNFAGGLGVHYFDNLTVFTSPVPEPATLAILGLGAVLLRKRK